MEQTLLLGTMKGSAETLLRRALAEGCVTVAELQGEKCHRKMVCRLPPGVLRFGYSLTSVGVALNYSASLVSHLSNTFRANHQWHPFCRVLHCHLSRRALTLVASVGLRAAGFGQMDYAGVARILKLDADLRETIVAVKLQEVRDLANSMQ